MTESSNCSLKLSKRCENRFLSSRKPPSLIFALKTHTTYLVIIILLKMPRPPPTHDSHRSMVCAFLHNGVLGKGKSNTTIKKGDVNYQRIIEFTPLKSYDPDDQKYPNGICTQHRTHLVQIAQVDKDQKLKPEEKEAKKNALIAKLDKTVCPSLYIFPGSARLMKNDTECRCLYCLLAEESCGTVGNTFGGAKSKRGRPTDPTRERSPPREAVMKCRKCDQEIGPGIPHPNPCTTTDRRRRLSGEAAKDSKLMDQITSININKKMEEAKDLAKAAASEVGDIATEMAKKGILKVQTGAPGKFKTIQVLKTPMDVKRQLYPPQTTHVGLSKLMAAAGTSKRTVTAFVKDIRATHGKKAVEPNIMKKLDLDLKKLGHLFNVVEVDMDPAGGPDGKDGHKSLIPDKVKRHLVYCTDVDALVEEIKKARGYHSQTRFLIKLGIDSGRDFLKVCLNIIKEEDELSSPAKKKAASSSRVTQRSTYADIYGNLFQESGVNGLLIIAICQRVSESIENLRLMLDKVGLQHAEIGTWTNTGDIKVVNCTCGLGSASSKHCCPFCELASDLFHHEDFIHEGGKLRSFKGIEKLALEYQAEAAKSTKAGKLSSAKWKNCEHVPICLPCDGNKDVLVIDCIAPMVSMKMFR